MIEKTHLTTVPDTNIILASSKSPSDTSPNLEYFERWIKREFKLLYSQDTLYEYAEKLYEYNIDEAIIEKIITSITQLGELINIEYFHLTQYPQDEDDIPFVLCAENGDATHIISYDRHLLDLNDFCHYKICKVIPFLKELREVLKNNTE